ncbi:MAG: DUF3667 domain-containing protein [Mucilaginibacter sp.]
MKKHYRHENNCLNCGATLHGKFCHVCGQENLEIKESFGHMMSHAISDYFHFDDQFFHTLKPLLFKPGKLTVEYMAGKRASYLHPVKMYIFISLIFFLLFFRGSTENQKQNESIPVTRERINDIKTSKKLTDNQKRKLLEALPYTIQPRKDGKGDDTVYRNIQGFLMIAGHDTSYQQYLNAQNKLSVDDRDGFLMRYVHKKAIDWKNSGENASTIILENFEHNMPKLMFLALPLFALLLKITFSRNKKLYIEHLIYSFHLHSFLFLFLSFTMLLQLITPSSWDAVINTINSLALFVVLWYVFVSLRTVYHRGLFRTITKMIGLSFAYFTLVMILASALFIATAALTS